jgi:hypothetical protein
MKGFTEYVVLLDGDIYAESKTLLEARTIYRSLINLASVEGREGFVELVSRKTSFKKLSSQSFEEEFIFDSTEFTKTAKLA